MDRARAARPLLQEPSKENIMLDQPGTTSYSDQIF